MDQLPRQTDIFQTVFTHAEIGIAVLSPDATVVRANDALGRLVARGTGDLEGMSFTSLLRSDRGEEQEYIEALAAGNAVSLHRELRMGRSDGSSIYAHVTYVCVPAEQGPTENIIAFVEDVTAEKEAVRAEREREQAIRRAYADVVSVMTGGRLLIISDDELPDQLGERVLGPIEFHDEMAPGEIRHAVRDYVRGRTPNEKWDDGFEVAMGEALLNALKHAGGGELSLHECGSSFQAVIRDRGSGIDFSAIARATVESGLTTAHTLGVGFTLILSFTSRILLTTGTDGTTIVLESHDGDTGSDDSS